MGHDKADENNQFDLITPAEVSLNAAAPAQAVPDPNKRDKKLFWLGMLFSALICLVLLVIFLLPNYVDQPPPPVLSTEETARPIPAGKPSTPWQEAQVAKQRKAAQDVLEQLLDNQFQLEEAAVLQWAEEAHRLALQLATEGDEFYRQQQFEKAREAYQAGLSAMQQLLAQKDQALADAIQRGETAITLADSASAKQAFELALAIEPDNQDALNGLQRAGKVDEIVALLKQAEDLERSGELSKALDILKQAENLDKQTLPAQEAIKRVSAAINEQEFNRLMTEGYSALGNNRHQQAITSFKKALALQGETSEAKEALREARHRYDLYRINRFIQLAEQHQGKEEWQKAVDEYDKALAIDSNLASVSRDREHAVKRLKIDVALQDAITKPERLASKEVYQAATKLLRGASTVDNPGPRLSKQLVTLKKNLEVAATPIPVQFQSDGLSTVTLYKIGQLGRFSRHEINLKPGSYIIAASRPGYRDVRKEFTVRPGNARLTLSIQCEEKI
jgi:tetratricopeptide (TPR) repeat protein